MNRPYPAIAVIFSGPSGVGKTTICQHLYAWSDKIHFSVSCTTRSPRAGERLDVHYHYLSDEEFKRRLEAGEFLEHAQIHRHSYGTLRSEVTPRLDSGSDVILDIDVQGAKQILANLAGQELASRFISVFLLPPSFATLEQRLRGRNTENAAEIERRLEHARREIEHWPEYDYVLVNQEGKAEQTAQQLWTIIQAARCRSNIQGKEFWHE
jgi:guanylate kinase